MPANWFDHAIASVAPRIAARRVLARQAFETLTRGYDGGSKGRRTDGWRAPGSSADTEIGVAGALLRDRMRDLVRNNPHAAKAVAVLVNNIVGSPSRHLQFWTSVGVGGLARSNFGDRLKLAQEVSVVLREVARDPCIAEQFADVSLDHRQLQMILAVSVLDGSDPLLQPGQFALHACHRFGRDPLDLLWL